MYKVYIIDILCTICYDVVEKGGHDNDTDVSNGSS